MEKLKILLADDHQVIRDGLRPLINAQPDMEVIGEAGDGFTALQKSRDCQPDIVIMDVSMPGMTGVKATEKLKQDRPEVKILALTAYEDKSYFEQLLRAGATGYVLKAAAADTLIKAIRVVAAGGTYLDPTLVGQVVSRFVLKPCSRVALQHRGITEREEEVLRLIAQGYINKEIAARLGISAKTVEAHKSNFMGKLGLRSRAEIVRYALSQGWLKAS